MPRKKPNKFLKINDKVVTLPKAAMGRGSRVYPNGRSSSNPFEEREKAATNIERFVEAVEQGSNPVAPIGFLANHKNAYGISMG